MKKILYIIICGMCLGCSHREQSSEAVEDTVYITPDSVWDYTYLDSIDRSIKVKSYEIYGDSSYFEEGLPDSMMLHNP